MKEGARVAILGSGGMGKTTLALAALHQADVEGKYPQRHFVSCESANGAGELISIVGLYLNLPQSKELSKAIYGYFLDCGPALLVLDNMETPWETLATRTHVEEFLSLLADIPHLALLVSIQGLFGARLIFSTDHYTRRRAAWKSEMDPPIPGPARAHFNPSVASNLH
jgi:hypothetical protein